jgi:hypothetical protein
VPDVSDTEQAMATEGKQNDFPQSTHENSDEQSKEMNQVRSQLAIDYEFVKQLFELEQAPIETSEKVCANVTGFIPQIRLMFKPLA